MKFLPILVPAFLLSLARPAPAADDRYEELGDVLKPFAALFTESESGADRALEMTIRIEQMTGLPAEMKDATAEIAVEHPDKVRVHGPVLGETVTLVRDGDRVWIHPGGKARSLLDGVVEGKELPPPDKKYKLTDFKLPIPANQLVFLPILFTVKDVGREPLDGAECRVMDLTLMPQLAKAVGAEGWVGRIWVKPDATPARLTLARSGWNVVMRFEKVAFSTALPASRWEPSAEEAGDVLELKPKEYSRFLRAIGGMGK